MTRCLWIGLIVLSSCDIFGAREPEPPAGEAGTWLQPVAPDLVIENLRAAVRELNATNYRRSIDPEFEFVPTAEAYAQSPDQWDNWNRSQENGYFITVAEASRGSSGNILRLEDPNTEFSDTEYILDAHYVLVINHGSQQVADTLQGRLVWVITKKTDGLWTLLKWNDQSVGSEDSWSDLKAEFAS
ncbi:MAG: hypothetical protein OXE92_06130 [Bacteroidetes bacterium]|nr:hypothetical protein [Bacteroidota bacterium]MCY4205286.1 hypothetical protein [Bacteroidota bacterium]